MAQLPDLSLLREDNARKGFFEPDQFQAVLKHLLDHLKLVFQVAYITGWRVPSKVLTRRWQHVYLEGGWLRLEPGESKNYEGRMFPMTPELTGILARQLEGTRQLEKATERIIPGPFTVIALRLRTTTTLGTKPVVWPACRTDWRTIFAARPSGAWSAPAWHDRPR